MTVTPRESCRCQVYQAGEETLRRRSQREDRRCGGSHEHERTEHECTAYCQPFDIATPSHSCLQGTSRWSCRRARKLCRRFLMRREEVHTWPSSPALPSFLAPA